MPSIRSLARAGVVSWTAGIGVLLAGLVDVRTAAAGACCIPGGSPWCIEAPDEPTCEAQGGTWRGQASRCAEDPNPCSLQGDPLTATGSCCDSFFGECTDGTRAGCLESAGWYPGDDTVCPCPQITGACCLPSSGTCLQLGPDECRLSFGTYMGDLVPCSQSDADGDERDDECDNCPGVPNGPNQDDQSDVDQDAVGDACDNCVDVANGPVEDDQSDLDADGMGDACDPDMDGDTVLNEEDNCPRTANGPGLGDQSDMDADLLGDACDNCPEIPNGPFEDDQADADGDRVGDACDGCPDDRNGRSYSVVQGAEPLEDITRSGSQLFLGDDDAVLVPLGFTFEYFGVPYAEVYISSNGFLTFQAEEADAYSNDCMPFADPPNAVIAPFWEDFDPTAGGVLLHETLGRAPDRRFVVTWSEFQLYGGVGDLHTFQVVLFETGAIELRYGPLGSEDESDGSFATVGVEGPSGVASTEVSCRPGFGLGVLAEGISYRFEPPLVQPDRDGDRIQDTCDNCPDDVNGNQVDRDDDGLGDRCDNCPIAWNFSQDDTDADGVGDECDNCLDTWNADQDDGDRDGVGDACDNCPEQPNGLQGDVDLDGLGDACDDDADADGVPNASDNCPADPNGAAEDDQADGDGDGAGDACDVCPDRPDDQSDIDEDGVGDSCDICVLAFDPASYGLETGSAFLQNIAGGSTPLGLAEDGSMRVPLGFSFPFYGVRHEDVVVSANGYLSFVAFGSTLSFNDCIPDPTLPDGVIAPFWEDFDPSAPGAEVWVATIGLAPDRRFVAQWDQVPILGIPGETHTFQAVLFENGEIEFRYGALGAHPLSDGSDATIGVENTPGTTGTQVACRQVPGPLREGISFRFTLPLQQADGDGDGAGDACDVCLGLFDDQSDADGDGVGDACDVCPSISDPDQANRDGDAWGDVCDNCPARANDQADGDGDGIGDLCDNCLADSNEDQADTDGNGTGDACDPDDDGDGVLDGDDNCQFVANGAGEDDQSDVDGDGVGDACDTCPDLPDDQSDVDGDDVGDACDNCPIVSNRRQYAPRLESTLLEDISSTGVPLGLGDDGIQQAAIGFDFPYYGVVRNVVVVSANGFLTFQPVGAGVVENNCIPDPELPNEFIAPFWEDFDPGLGGEVYRHVLGSPPDRRFIVQWHRVPLKGGIGTRHTFQVLLYETTGEIEMRYGRLGSEELSHGSDATVGIENADASLGTLLSCRPGPGLGLLAEGRSFRFAPPLVQPDSDADGVGDRCDNCPELINDQSDLDADGVGDPCDNCPDAPNGPMEDGQADGDGDGTGDACDADADTDEDGVANPDDNCPQVPNGPGEDDQADRDADGWGDACDNCPDTFNPSQSDADCECDAAPPEVLTGLDGDAHLIIRKGFDHLLLDWADAGGVRSPALFGRGTAREVLDHYNVYRGLLTWPFQHAAGVHDEAEGCAVRQAPVVDTAACGGPRCWGNGRDYYYLVAAECVALDLEGPLGFGSELPPLRDVPIPAPSPACP